jgi:hypothetical protein
MPSLVILGHVVLMLAVLTSAWVWYQSTPDRKATVQPLLASCVAAVGFRYARLPVLIPYALAYGFVPLLIPLFSRKGKSSG